MGSQQIYDQGAFSRSKKQLLIYAGLLEEKELEEVMTWLYKQQDNEADIREQENLQVKIDIIKDYKIQRSFGNNQQDRFKRLSFSQKNLYSKILNLYLGEDLNLRDF